MTAPSALTIVLFGHQVPQLVGAMCCQRTTMRNRAAKFDDVFGLVAAFYAFPARVLFPFRFELFDLLCARFAWNEVERHGCPSELAVEAGEF